MEKGVIRLMVFNSGHFSYWKKNKELLVGSRTCYLEDCTNKVYHPGNA
jgi:hypothetical protein